MGVAIYGYKHIEPTDQFGWVDDWNERIVPVYTYKEFRHALDGMPDQDREFEEYGTTFVGGRAYKVGGSSKNTFKRSYSGYSAFRRELCRAFLLAEPEDVWEMPGVFKAAPFYDLINFSDCEGTFGPVASRRIADNFNNHGNPFDKDDAFGRNYDGYKELKEIFNHAADTGIVVFA